MKKIVVFFCLLLWANCGKSANIYWIGTTPIFDLPDNWSFTPGGPACWCVPGVTDVAVFDGFAALSPILVSNATIGAIEVTGLFGAINLNGYDLTIGGLASPSLFMSGLIMGPGTLSITSSSAATFGGTSFSADVNVQVDLTTAAGIFTSGGGTVFGGPLNVTAYSILLNGSTFNGTTTLTKTGAVDSFGAGGNTFNQAVTVNNTSTHILRTAGTTGDTFSGDVTLNLNTTATTSSIQVSYGAGTNSYFNGHVIVNSTDNGTNVGGITFGSGGGASQLADGKQIMEGATGFRRGTLSIQNFTQLGVTSQVLDLWWTGSASGTALILVVTNSTFNGNVDFTASNLNLGGTNNFFGFSNVFTKTSGGSGTTNIAGNSVYNQSGSGGTTTFENFSTSTLSVTASLGGDTFNGNVHVIPGTTTGPVRLAQTGTSYFYGDIVINYFQPNPTAVVRFGTALMVGSADQDITAELIVPIFTNLTMNKTAGCVTLNYPIEIAGSLTLTSGVVTGSSTNFVRFVDNATATGASNASYIDGSIQKIGNDSFTFPVGAGGYYLPLSISAPSVATDQFEVTLNNFSYSNVTSMESGLAQISSCNYWILDRLAGTSDVVPTLSWNDNACFEEFDITQLADMRVTQWSGAQWSNLGNAGTTGTGLQGSVTAATVLSNYGSAYPLTLGTVSLNNVLPVELIRFEVTSEGSAVTLLWTTASEYNNQKFEIQHSDDGRSFYSIGEVAGHGTTHSPIKYDFSHTLPIPGYNYYRLVQHDFDGRKHVSEIRSVKIDFKPGQMSIEIFPNPAHDGMVINAGSYLSEAIVRCLDPIGNSIVWQQKFIPFGWRQNIDVSGLKAGVYVVIVESATSNWSSKVIVK